MKQARVLPKKLQIRHIARRLEKMGIDPDTVDLEALIDENLRFTENWDRVLEIVRGGKKNPERYNLEGVDYGHRRRWGRKITIVGLQGSGKTYLTQNYFLKRMKQHLVIDPNDEYQGYNRYVPKFADDFDKLKEELKLVVKRLIKPNVRWIEKAKNKRKVKKPLRLVVFDEADLYMPSRKTLPAPLRYLYVECRHMQLDLIAITRRLTDINAYPVEVSDYLIVFKQAGYNDLKRLREIGGKEAEEMMREKVDYNKHNFLFFDRDRTPRLVNSMMELEEYLPYP